MKKFSSLLVVFMCFITLFLAGCSKADNATLLSIDAKYNYIANKQDKIFVGSRFLPTYNSDNLINAINSSINDYNVLKTDSSIENFTNRGLYGILMESVNSTYLNSNASSVIQNNEITQKKYKKAMYLALERLQKNAKKLDTSKISLESVFNNDNRGFQIVCEQDLTKHNLNKYIKYLNVCLNNLYDFNKNYNLALNNNIIVPIKLDDLLYGLNATTTISNEYITMLVNNINLMISNFALNYSIELKQDIMSAKDLIEKSAEILTQRKRVNSEDKQNALDNYKILRTLENGLLNTEVAFNNACKSLNQNSFVNSSEQEILAINLIENFKNELLSYANHLIAFLKGLS